MQDPQNEKKRHWCLFAYLVLILVAYTLLAFVYFITPSYLYELAFMSGYPDWFLYAMGILAVLYVISAFAVLRWKKWVFWLFTLTAFVPFCVNLYSGMFAIYSLLSEFIVVAILYGVLQIGGDKKGWSQLE